MSPSWPRTLVCSLVETWMQLVEDGGVHLSGNQGAVRLVHHVDLNVPVAHGISFLQGWFVWAMVYSDQLKLCKGRPYSSGILLSQIHWGNKQRGDLDVRDRRTVLT